MKVSGDLIEQHNVLWWIGQIAAIENYVVICTGGGTQINEAFAERGIKPDFGPLGRKTNTFEERQLARDVLERNQAKVQDLLMEYEIHAEVIIPVVYAGSVLCHVNGDTMVETVYNGFDQIYVLTREDRAEAKREEFKEYPKIKVVGFSAEEIREAV
jgi:acetylglutamate kinase